MRFANPFFSVQIHQPLDPVTKQRKGIAYVTFAQPSNALAAYEALDKKSFQGRLLHILGAVDRSGKVDVEIKKSVKDQKTAKRKLAAGKDFNWGILYMNVRRCVCDLINPVPDNKAERRSGIFHRRTDEH
jgi:multiple RNA-binding domain-containing protein 1